MAPLDAVQDETTPGAPAHGLGIGSSRLDGHSGPLAAFTRRGHGFLSADGPLARQGIRTVTFVFRGRRVVINRMSPLDRLIHSPDHRRMAAICAKETAGVDVKQSLRMATKGVGAGEGGPSWLSA